MLSDALPEKFRQYIHDLERRCGQGSSHLRLLPNRKNLLKIDWSKL
jgi:hypothetical protein